MAAYGYNPRSNYGQRVSQQHYGTVCYGSSQQQQQQTPYSGRFSPEQASLYANRRHHHQDPQYAEWSHQHDNHHHQHQQQQANMYGGYRYARHHYQQPSISGVTPQAVETNSLELIHRAKMSEFSAFKVQTSNEKAMMRFQIKNLVSLVMSGMQGDDRVNNSEAEDAITEEAILAAAAHSMENLAALMNKCHKKSPAAPSTSADGLLPAAASPVSTTTTIDTCSRVPADTSAPLLPTLLEPAALISTFSLDSSRSSSTATHSSSSAAADTPIPTDPVDVASGTLPAVLTTPATLEGGLKHVHTCSNNLSTRRSSLCGPVVTVPIPVPSAPAAGAGAVNPTQLVSPGIAAAGLTVLATIEPPTAAAAASPTAASSGSSNDGSPRRRGKGRSRRNRKSGSSSGNSGSGTGSPKAAAAVSNALKNLRSPGIAAQASSAWC